jgi:4-amino-4-deoxy-L-arabinose transferase-like glycosyltransferase
MESATTSHPRSWNSTRLRDRLRAVPLPRPELAALLALAAVLYLWGLGKNGFANDYYSAAVRSMAGSWHDFLYGSFDAKGLMTVDKPPLALWVEALSAKLFGFDSLAILVPQALMGVASVGLLYDLVRRHWGRIAGTVAGLALALTPVIVAVSRHNNPDALLVLCSVGALWCFVRALEGGATRWLVAAGVCVGLGFEAKMGAALMVLPGMALAWLWVAPRGRAVAVRQLAWAGAALVAVALAWPVLVWLTPASARPWISGTSDNSIWSLIWEYNGFGRLEGQTGGPGSFGGGGGGPFGGETGVFRLLNEALGGQAGWLLGAALVGGLGIAALSRLRREDPRTGWIVAVGGAFGVTAIAFSFAGGIFHPYYTSLLAPFAAALVGATVGQVLAGERGASAVPTRILGALAIGAGAIVELVVIDRSATDLGRLVAPLAIVSIAAVAALLFADSIAGQIGFPGAGPHRIRTAALACAVGVLLLGPAIWSVETLGHPTSGTFPAGGPESASRMGGPGGGMGASGGPMGGSTGGGVRPSSNMGLQRTNAPSFSPGEGMGGTAGPPAMGGGMPGATGGPQGMTGGAAGPGGMFGGEDMSAIVEYTEANGGGTIAVDSQSGAAASIIESGAEVAGIGGFSGKESSVSAAWLEERIEAGDIAWIYTSGLGGTTGGASAGSESGGPGVVGSESNGPGGGFGPGGAIEGESGGPSGGDTRTGSESAIETVVKQCTAVDSSAYSSASEGTSESAGAAMGVGGGSGTLYECGGS